MVKQYPEPVVGAFIFNAKGQLLLVQSYKWKNGLWHVPGGHIELGESIEQATVREVREEVGLDVNNVEVFKVWEGIFPENFSRKKHFIFLECKCAAVNDQAKPDGEEIQNARWFSLKEAVELDLEAFTRKSISLLQDSEGTA